MAQRMKSPFFQHLLKVTESVRIGYADGYDQFNNGFNPCSGFLMRCDCTRTPREYHQIL